MLTAFLVLSVGALANLDFWPRWCKVDHCGWCFPDRSDCDWCRWGYWLYNNQCLDCNLAVGWCEICSKEGPPCLLCQKGFYLTDNGLCDICHNGISMCKYCSKDGSVCYECLDNYDLVNNRCVYSPNKNCPKGKFELNGQCVSCVFGVNWCSECSADGSTCYKCDSGFYLTSNKCKQCFDGIPHCLKCTTYGEKCTSCIQGWTLRDGKCH